MLVDISIVSVPLSGLISVNNGEESLQFIPKGFRPLIGVNFCKQYEMREVGIFLDSMFPSPYRG